MNQGKANDVIGITTSNNKTHTAESIQQNTKTTKQNVAENKEDTSSNKRIDNDLKKCKTCLYFRG